MRIYEDNGGEIRVVYVTTNEMCSLVHWVGRKWSVDSGQ